MASGGLLLNVDVHAADIQDRDGAETLLRQARRRFPFVERSVADAGYAGPRCEPSSPAPAIGSSRS